MGKRGAIRKTVIYLAAAVVAAAVLYVFLSILFCDLQVEAGWCSGLPHLSMEQIEGYIKGAGPWGVLVSIGLMVAHSFVPFPGELIAMANGMIYGVLWGTVITWTGAMLGASLAFGITRRLGSGFVHRMLERKKALKVEDWAVRHGGGAVFVMRFIPVISFNLINYAAGLTRISWWTFLWATGIGILPITTLMVVMGAHMETMQWYEWLVLAAAGLSMWGLGHLAYVRLYGRK